MCASLRISEDPCDILRKTCKNEFCRVRNGSKKKAPKVIKKWPLLSRTVHGSKQMSLHISTLNIFSTTYVRRKITRKIQKSHLELLKTINSRRKTQKYFKNHPVAFSQKQKFSQFWGDFSLSTEVFTGNTQFSAVLSAIFGFFARFYVGYRWYLKFWESNYTCNLN